MRSDSVSATGGGENNDTISLRLSGGNELQMSESFATRLNNEMTDISSNVDSSNRYSADDDLFTEVDQSIQVLDQAKIMKYTGNRDHLDSSAEMYIMGLNDHLKAQQGNARSSGGVDVGDAGLLKEFADDFRGAFDSAMADKYPDAAPSGGSSETGTSGGASGDMDMGGVKEALAEVKSSDNSSAKSSALGKAIDALIAQIKGGGEAAPAEGRAGELQEDIGKLKDAIGGGSEIDEPGGPDAGSGGNGGGGGGEPAPAPAPVTERLEGDALMGRLAGGLTLGDMTMEDLKLNFDDSDGGIGIGDDEIGRGEKMTFTPQSPADGATVELVDLFGGEKGGQENGTIKVMKDGEQVDEIAVRGDMDGNQSVKIDQPFDELVFESNGKESDFAIKSITTETGGAAPEGTGGADGADETPGVDDGAQAQFDETQLLELLQALSETIGLIDGSTSLSEDDKGMLLDKVAEVVGSMVDALDAGGEGGGAVTNEEVATILEGVSGLNEGIEGAVDDSSDKNDVLDSLAMGVGQVADAMAA